MKVYAVIEDFRGYEEHVDGIFSTQESALEYIYNEYISAEDVEDEKRDYAYFCKHDALVEWELDTQKINKIDVSYEMLK